MINMNANVGVLIFIIFSSNVNYTISNCMIRCKMMARLKNMGTLAL